MRDKIERMLRKPKEDRRASESVRAQARKYLPFFDCNHETLVIKFYTHRAHMNMPEARAFNKVYIPAIGIHATRDGVNPVTLETFAQKLLEIGDKSLDYLREHPQDVDLNAVNASQRLLIEKQKVNVAESALKLQMNKLLGGFPDTSKAIEGEIDNGNSTDPKVPRVIQSSHKE